MTSVKLGEFKPTYNERQAEQKKYLEQLSSGKRAGSARDDATAVAIATKISADSGALAVAAGTASVAQAVLNVADGGLNQTAGVLDQLKSIATLAQSGTASPSDLANLNTQFTALVGELNSIASTTSFNGQSLLDGTSPFASGVGFQVGAGAGDTISVTTATTTASSLGLTGANVLTAANASAAVGSIDAALSAVSNAQAQVGADSAAFATRVDLISISRESADASVSALVDADIGKASTGAATAAALSQSALIAIDKKNAERKQLLALLN